MKKKNWKNAAALLLVLAIFLVYMPIGSAETTTVYHETFAGGKGVAVQSGGASLKPVTGKNFDGNEDGAALYISTRTNNWDAADFRISDTGLENGKTYFITVTGYVDADVKVPAGAQAWLQTVNSYGFWGSADFKAGEAFTLTGSYTVDTSKDTSIRVQSNTEGATVPFYIGDILITADASAPAAETVTETTDTAAAPEAYHETFTAGKGVAVQSGGASLKPVTDKKFEGNEDGAALYISTRTNNWDAADFKFSDTGLENGKTYTITVEGYVDSDVKVPAGAQAWLQTVNSYGFWGSADFKAGEAFTLTGKYTVDTSNDTSIRVQSNTEGAAVPFYVGDILITAEASEAAAGGDAETKRAPAEEFKAITFEDQTMGGVGGRATTEILTLTEGVNHTDDGKYALKVEGRTNTWHGPALRVEKYVDEGSEYEISVWVKLISPSSSQLQLSTQIGNGSGANYVNLSPKTIQTSDGWVELTGTYRYSNVSSEFLTIYVESTSNAEASFYIDDISFKNTNSGDIEIQEFLKPLKAPYKNNFLIGTAISAEDLKGVRFDLLRKHFNSATAGNAMKPDAMQRTEGNFTFDAADEMIEMILAEGIQMHGHTLVWHQQSPAWLNTTTDAAGKTVALSREEALENLRTHIMTVIEHFADKVISWDVVNEAISDNPSNPSDWKASLRQTPWYDAIGEDYVEQAFLAAREVLEAHPDWNIKLYYNDYNLDNQNKSLATYNMVKELNEKYQKDHPGKVLVDGVGMQGHYQINTNPTNVELSLERFISLGCEVSITELDVQAGSNHQLSEDQANAQGYLYAELFKIFSEHSDNITRVTLWGTDDGTSWRSSTNPLLFDKNLQAKPAYFGVIDPDKFIVENKPETPEDANQSTANYGTPVIDGKVDALWSNTAEMSVSRYQMAWQGASGTAKALWDNQSLYVLFQVSDAQLDKTSANAWEQDSVEVFLDENNAKTSFYQDDDGQFRVNFENTASFSPASVSAGFESAVTVSGTSYTVEVKIPFKAITPEVNTKLGFDVQINDGKDGARQSAATWNDLTGNGYQDTSVHGVLTLMKGEAPSKKLTRGEGIVTILKAYAMKPLASAENNFSDAAGDNAGYYAQAKAIGMTRGVGNNKLGADLPLTREMLFTMLYTMELNAGRLPSTGAAVRELSTFSDYADLSEWSVKAFTELVQAGVVKGEKLLPKSIVDLKELETILSDLTE